MFSRLGPPQYSELLPEQTMLQSLAAAGTPLLPIEVPQSSQRVRLEGGKGQKRRNKSTYSTRRNIPLRQGGSPRQRMLQCKFRHCYCQHHQRGLFLRLVLWDCHHCWRKPSVGSMLFFRSKKERGCTY